MVVIIDCLLVYLHSILVISTMVDEGIWEREPTVILYNESHAQRGKRSQFLL